MVNFVRMGSGVTWEKEEDKLLAWSWFAASEDLSIRPVVNVGEEGVEKAVGKEVATQIAGAGIDAGAEATSENDHDIAPSYIVIVFIILCLVIAICICLNRRKRRSSTSTLNGTNTN